MNLIILVQPCAIQKNERWDKGKSCAREESGLIFRVNNKIKDGKHGC